MRDEALQRIANAKLRRLEILEEQIAIVGEAHAEPSQITERDQIRKQLGLADAVLSMDDETRRLFRRYDQADLNIAVLSKLNERVTMIENWIAVAPEKTRMRQLKVDLWMAVLTILLLAMFFSRLF